MGIGRKLRRGTIRPVVDENGNVLFFIDKKGRRIDPLKQI
jgi:ribosomal protein L24E